MEENSEVTKDPTVSEVSDELQLVVNREELRQGLSRLGKVNKHSGRGSQALLSFENKHLRISISGSTIGIPAQGNWPGVARVQAAVIIAIRAMLPDPELISLRFAGERFYIGTWSTDAEWQSAGPFKVKLPLDPPRSMLASLYRKYSENDLIASGLATVLEAEQIKRQAAIRRAKDLFVDYGVSEEDISELIDRSVDRYLEHQQ